MKRVVVAVAAGVVWLATLVGPAFAVVGPRAGRAVVVGTDFVTPLKGGNSKTKFSLAVPRGSACQGDSADGQYRVQSFLVPAKVNVGTLLFQDLKPQADDSFVLYDTATLPYWNTFTDKADTKGGPGRIIDIPVLSFAVFGEQPGLLKPGRYQVGVACTLFAKTTRYWSSDIVITADPHDEPAHIAWRVVDPPKKPGRSLSSYLAYIVFGVIAVLILVVIVKPDKKAKPDATERDAKVTV
ncbi:MAG TPA: hypothetical protein VHD87_13285 [Acidimicrobiales bacterium]|nr:hypothetical protein [Acidimicrobiales bacterium]